MMFFTEEKKNETHIEFPTAKIEETIGYSFKIKGLLLQAFTRSSYAEEHNMSIDNERLEFIGDSILGMIIAKLLTKRYQRPKFNYFKNIEYHNTFDCELDEGELSEMKINFVKKSSLAEAIGELGIEKHLRMSNGDMAKKIYEEASVKEDLFEAIIGAIAIDSNWDMPTLERVIIKLIDVDKRLECGFADEPDYEKQLEEWFELKKMELVFEERNSDLLNLDYCYSVCLGHDFLEKEVDGYGKTPKEARRMLARRAVKFMETCESRAIKVFENIGDLDFNRAVNQLQELYQKKVIPEPVYRFNQAGISDTGNPIWECSCTIPGIVDGNGGYIADSKSEAKKCAAFDTLSYLVGRNLAVLFEKYGTKMSMEEK